jgi:AraC-type DNA-binding domain-containing proteins
MQTYNIIIDKNKKETTQHGSFEFPLAIYTTQINKNILGFIDWHWHEELQFCIVTNGVVHFIVDGDSIILSEGEAIFINKDELHKAIDYLNHDSSYICFDFHINLISSFMGSIINKKYIQPYTDHPAIQYCVLRNTVSWQKLILEKLIAAYQLYNRNENRFELEIFILLLEIWHTLIKHYFESFPSDYSHINSNINLRKVMDYIHSHYMEKIELAELADELNLSKTSFCRKFKKHMNCTVFEYIINYRLSKAAGLLLNTNDTISDIAYHCGFGSTSYFIEKFKMKTNLSPLSYRKEQVNIRK